MSEFIPVVAVLMAAYNGAKWIEDQVRSILTQSDVSVVVYISVDLSDDETFEICRRVGGGDSRVIVLPQTNYRFGDAAKNFFRLIRDVNFESFDYIAFADQDDIWLPNKLQRAHYHLQSHSCDGYSTNVTALWPDGRRTLVNKSQPQMKWDYYFEAAGPGCTYVMTARLAEAIKQCVLAHRERIEEVALHDWFCYAFARSKGYSWYIDPEPSMLYRQHAFNQFGANTGIKALRSRLRQIYSGWWLSQVRLQASILQARELPLIFRLDTSFRPGLFGLSLRAWHCRRRVRDKMFFVLICWLLMLRGPDNG